MPESVDDVFRTRGVDGLKQLPHIGETIAARFANC